MLAGYLDSTNLKAEATAQDIRTLCKQADRLQMAAVCVNPGRLPLAAGYLKDSAVKICTVIGFPLGANHGLTKLCEARLALEHGAHELDLVMNIGAFLDGEYQQVRKEIKSLLKLKQDCPYLLLKVIVETALLTETQLIEVTKLVSDTEADFIKTSTGFAGRGVSLKDIEIINAHKRSDLKVKASGGVRELDFALQLVNAGVNRIGSSNAMHLVEEYFNRGGHEGS